MEILIFYEYLAAILRSARVAVKLTQSELASRAGVTRRYIQLLENGKQEATLSTFFTIADALSLSPVQLLADLEYALKNGRLPEHIEKNLRPRKPGRPLKSPEPKAPFAGDN